MPTEALKRFNSLGTFFDCSKAKMKSSSTRSLLFFNRGLQLQQRVGNAQWALRRSGTGQCCFGCEFAFQHGLQEVKIIFNQAVG